MADNAERQPWEYGHRTKKGEIEAPGHYQYFRDYYLPLGPGRTIPAAAKAAGLTKSAFTNLSAAGEWRERARAWDAHNAAEWRLEVDEEAKAAYQAELRRFREDQQRRARTLGRVADLMIAATTRTLEAMEAEGSYVEPEQLATVARAAGSLVTVSMETAAAALGVSDILEALSEDQ